MCDIKSIKTLIFVENVLCIYRNYSFYGDKAKKIILSRVVIETCFYLAITVNDMYVLYEYFHENFSALCMVISYNFIFICYSMVCTIHSIYRSDSFKDLINTFGKVHENFNKDISYNSSLNNLNFKCTLGVVAYLVMTSVDIIHERLTHKSLHLLIVFDILLNIMRIIGEYRYLIEYLVYSLFVVILHNMFKRFNLSLDQTQKKLVEKINEDGNISDEIDLRIIDGWITTYRDLVKSSQAFRNCFGAQIIAAIAMSLMHYVIISYRLWVILLQAQKLNQIEQSGFILLNLAFSVTYHIIAIMTAIMVSQKVLNEVHALRISLARLYNILTVYPNRPELKKIRNFCRLVAKNPVEISVVPEMSVGMAVLPTCVSLGVTYVIMMMQLNNKV